MKLKIIIILLLSLLIIIINNYNIIIINKYNNNWMLLAQGLHLHSSFPTQPLVALAVVEAGGTYTCSCTFLHKVIVT